MNKKIVSMLSACILSLSISSVAFAYTTTGTKYPDAKFTYSSQLTKYYSEASSARSAWTNAYSKITWTYDDSTTDVSFYNGNYGNTTYNAITNYSYSGGITSSSTVSCNEYYMEKYTSSKNQAIITHELGHVLGLDHVTDTTQIMCTDAGGRTATVPGSDDIKGAKALYP